MNRLLSALWSMFLAFFMPSAFDGYGRPKEGEL